MRGRFYIKHIFTPDEDATLRQMYEGGAQLWKIEDALGVTKTVIYRRIKELNLKRPPDYNRFGFYGIFVRKGNHFKKV